MSSCYHSCGGQCSRIGKTVYCCGSKFWESSQTLESVKYENRIFINFDYLGTSKSLVFDVRLTPFHMEMPEGTMATVKGGVYLELDSTHSLARPSGKPDS